MRNIFLRLQAIFQYFLDAIIKASAQSETVESCSGGSGGLIRLNASHVIHELMCNLQLLIIFLVCFFIDRRVPKGKV